MPFIRLAVNDVWRNSSPVAAAMKRQIHGKALFFVIFARFCGDKFCGNAQTVPARPAAQKNGCFFRESPVPSGCHEQAPVD
jgi:hypothetical protein